MATIKASKLDVGSPPSLSKKAHFLIRERIFLGELRPREVMSGRRLSGRVGNEPSAGFPSVAAKGSMGQAQLIYNKSRLLSSEMTCPPPSGLLKRARTARSGSKRFPTPSLSLRHSELVDKLGMASAQLWRLCLYHAVSGKEDNCPLKADSLNSSCLSDCFSIPQAQAYGHAAPSVSQNLAQVPVDVRYRRGLSEVSG